MIIETEYNGVQFIVSSGLSAGMIKLCISIDGVRTFTHIELKEFLAIAEAIKILRVK